MDQDDITLGRNACFGGYDHGMETFYTLPLTSLLKVPLTIIYIV
jgi:hypothetical protein